MVVNLAMLNARAVLDPSKCSRLPGELSNHSVHVTAVQETHFTCTIDYRVLGDEFVVVSAYDSHSSVGIPLLIGRSVNADVILVLADDAGLLVVAEIGVKSFEFRVVAASAPNIAAEWVFLQ